MWASGFPRSSSWLSPPAAEVTGSARREHQMQHVDVVEWVLGPGYGRSAGCSLEGTGPTRDGHLDRLERERPDPCHLPPVQHPRDRALDQEAGRLRRVDEGAVDGIVSELMTVSHQRLVLDDLVAGAGPLAAEVQDDVAPHLV